MRRQALFGFVLAAGFVAVSAGRDVLAQEQDVPYYFALGVGFLPAALLALGAVAGVPSLRPTAGAGGRARLILAINTTTLINWLLYFVSLSKIGAVLFSAIVVGCMPMSLLLLQALVERRPIRPAHVAAALLVLAGVGALSADHFRNLAAADDPADQAVGVALALLTSLSSAANNWLVARLTRSGYGAVATFAMRFWLLLAAAAP
jgi:drug/metabolite transporter (DMT)-like permease